MNTINLMLRAGISPIEKNLIDFRHYDNPGKAHRIVIKYFSGPANITEGCVKVINGIVSNYKNCNDLDFALDAMFLRGRKVVEYPCPAFGGGSSGPSDPDANGSWGNAVKMFEENTNHDPFLLT